MLVVPTLETLVPDVVAAELEDWVVTPDELAVLLVLGAAVVLTLVARVPLVVPELLVELVRLELVVPELVELALVVGADVVVATDVLVPRVVLLAEVEGAAVLEMLVLFEELDEDLLLLDTLDVEELDAVLGAAVVAVLLLEAEVLLRLGAAVLVDALLDELVVDELDELTVLLDEVELLLRAETVLAVEFCVPCVELVELVVLELDELLVGVVARNVPRNNG